MAKSVEKYARSVEVKINKNCKVQCNVTNSGDTHVKIIAFGSDSVNLSEETFKSIVEAYHLIVKREASYKPLRGSEIL